MKHQRRASDTLFSKRAWVKYEPLTKNKNDTNSSPKHLIPSKQNLRNKLLSQRGINNRVIDKTIQDEIIGIDTNNTFYEKNSNAVSFYNHRSFLLKDNQFIQDPTINTAKKKVKKPKVQGTAAKKKTHTKGNNSVYMKDFEKLMKERSYADNKSLKRMKGMKANETTDVAQKPKPSVISQNLKTVKKSKKNVNAISNKQLYHKRVKSDQIYSVKLLLRGKEKPANNVIPSIAASNTFRSENCTPRKLKALYKMNYEATCLALANKNLNDIENNKNNDDKIYNEIGYKNMQMSGKRTANVSVNVSNNSQASTSKDLSQYKNSKKSSMIASTVISPNKISHIENNKKTLYDYHKEKRSPPEINNLVIVVNDKQDKTNKNNNNLLSKYLRKDLKDVSKSAVISETKPRLSAKKNKVIEFPSPDDKNTFTVTSSSKKGTKVDINEFYAPGKEQKLKALHNMPIKKFIVSSSEENSYRSKLQEEEKIPKFDNFLVKKKDKKKDVDESNTSTKIAGEFYRIGKVLGKGAFGKVNLAIHKESGELVAMKSINKTYLSDITSKNKVMQEVSILKMIKHKNIMWLKDTFETEKHIIFVLELWPGGDLLNYVRRRRKLNENTAKVIFKQILEALDYCHNKSILHRDIKLDNILLDSKGKVKVGDFGVSKIVQKDEIMTDQWGTPAYIAPEILMDQGYTGFGIDVWSAGVVLYAMLYGTVPFKAHNMKDLHASIITAKYSLKDSISENAIDLLRRILEPDPNKRFTIPQIFKHPWYNDINEDIELFNDQEKEKIVKEFFTHNTSRYNRNVDNLILENDEINNTNTTDSFTEHHLSTQNSLIRNHSTKSVILAPFNSTISELSINTKEAIKKLMQDRKCLKFHARWRDVNRQYEMNNNCELDNGVYNKFMLEGDKEDKDN